jgi:predicted enzyme related to lactoylglutathione lyase
MTSQGNLVHFSIPTDDAPSSTKFYESLFGWKFQKMTETYWLIEGGIGSLSLEKEPVSGTMPILYFSIPQIEDGLAAVVNLGGEVVLKKTDAGDGKSFFATFRDKTGNVVGLWSKT